MQVVWVWRKGSQLEIKMEGLPDTSKYSHVLCVIPCGCVCLVCELV